MFFIKDFTKITEEKYSIGFEHHMPFDKVHGYIVDGRIPTEEEFLKEGKLVSRVDPLKIDNKISVMYYNPISNIVFYEYEDIKAVEPKDEVDIQKRLESVEIAIANMMGGI